VRPTRTIFGTTNNIISKTTTSGIDTTTTNNNNNNNNNFDDDNNNIIYSGKVDGRDTIFLDEALVLGQKTALMASLHCPPNCHTSIAAADHHHPLGEYDWALDGLRQMMHTPTRVVLVFIGLCRQKKRECN
jgi:hypothetical protein